jgi:hypothetical protein
MKEKHPITHGATKAKMPPMTSIELIPMSSPTSSLALMNCTKIKLEIGLD